MFYTQSTIMCKVQSAIHFAKNKTKTKTETKKSVKQTDMFQASSRELGLSGFHRKRLSLGTQSCGNL